MLLWKASGRILMFYHTEKEKQTGLRRGKRSGISTQEKIPQWEKCAQQQQEDARPGEADLGNLSERQLSLWSSVELGKEANPSRHTRVPFYTCSPKLWEEHIELQGHLGAWTGSKWYLQRKSLGTLTLTGTRRAIRTLQAPMWW